MATLPLRALIDTGVFIRRLGDQAECKHAPACIEFCNRMTARNRRLFVAAPTITEVTRFQSPVAPPAMHGIITVPFDDVAAIALGKLMPMDEIRRCRSEYYKDCRQNHIKYDALIVGCALRVPNVVFVGIDEKQLKLAREVKLSAYMPHEFLVEEPEPSRGGEQQRLSGLFGS